MKHFNRPNLSIFILMLETLLLFLASILGNKISELLQIPDATLLIVITIVLLTVILGLTYFRETGAVVSGSYRWRFRLTQKRVTNFVFWSWYGSCALFLAFGVIAFTSYLDKNWTAWVLNVSVIAIVFTAPLDLKSTVERGYRRWPVAVFTLLATLYGCIGFILKAIPTLMEQNLTLFIIIWSVLITGLKFTVLTHLMETLFVPWVKKLPEK